MNKLALSTLAMSSILALSACSSSGSNNRFGHAKHASYSSCPSCGQGGYAVRHAHANQRSNGSGLATVAGALLVGGLLYNAIDDDDDEKTPTHAK